jgi:hypothetical protein
MSSGAVVEDASTASSSSSSSSSSGMELHVDTEHGVQLNFPAGWRKWSSPEFEAQGGVVSFTPDAEVSDQPTVSLNLMLYPDGAFVLVMSYFSYFFQK